MDNTILFQVSGFYVFEFILFFSSLTKIIAAWRNDNPLSVSLLASKQLELLLLWGLPRDFSGVGILSLSWSWAAPREDNENVIFQSQVD